MDDPTASLHKNQPALAQPGLPIMTTEPQVIAVSGPSGVGKGTLITRLLDRHPGRFVRSVSHTTRDPRPGETDTNDYHFVTSHAFKSLINQGAFVEHTVFSGNQYGTSWQAIEKRHIDSRILVLDIDMEGVEAIKVRQNIPLRCAYIAPPSLDTLEVRLRSRGTETEESLRERLAKAKEEMDFAVDTAGSDDMIIVNNDLDTSYLEFEQWALSVSQP